MLSLWDCSSFLLYTKLIFKFTLSLQEPNPNDPLNHEAAELMRTNIYSFNENVRKTVRGGYVAGQKFPKLI
jgi:ubiquitin-conjugating enzyme E2 M